MRLTPEREKEIRQYAREGNPGWGADICAELLAELDAVRAERDTLLDCVKEMTGRTKWVNRALHRRSAFEWDEVVSSIEQLLDSVRTKLSEKGIEL